LLFVCGHLNLSLKRFFTMAIVQSMDLKLWLCTPCVKRRLLPVVPVMPVITVFLFHSGFSHLRNYLYCCWKPYFEQHLYVSFIFRWLTTSDRLPCEMQNLELHKVLSTFSCTPLSIANIIIEIGQQHLECCMVILKNRIKSVTQRFFQEGHLKSGTFGINSGHRDILSKNRTVPGKTGRMGTLY
jgi:hypothetical protein